jgi:aminopeptidase N
MTFAVGEFDTVRIHHSSNNLPMTIYAKTNQIAAVRYAFETLPEILDAYESYFGDYPFDKLDYVLTPKGSMEHQTLINIASSEVLNAFNTKNKYHSTIIHELAHMWFGNSVTPFDFRDAWLNESFASFCEALIYEKIIDKPSYIKHLREQGLIYFNYGIPREGAQPLYDFDRVKASNYPITIYYKGSNVLSILRYLVGDEKFLGALNHYLSKYAYGNVNTEQFINTFEEFTQTDMSEFFEKWVYEAGWIELQVDVNSVIDRGDGSYESNVTLRQIQSNKGLPNVETPIEFSYSQINMTPINKIVMLDANDQAVQFISDEHAFPSISSYRINYGTEFVVPARIVSYTSVESNEIEKPYEISDTQFAFGITSDSYTGGVALITDLSGRIIESVKFDNMSVSFDKNILANGLYFVIINLNNQIFIEKFIK